MAYNTRDEERWFLKNLPHPAQTIPRWMVGQIDIAITSYCSTTSTGIKPWARPLYRLWSWWRSRRPLKPDLVYSATQRCPCGAGLAYDKNGPSGGFGGHWDCSAILLGEAAHKGTPGAVKHCDIYPFMFWKIASEKGELTTRPKA